MLRVLTLVSKRVREEHNSLVTLLITVKENKCFPLLILYRVSNVLRIEVKT